MYFFLEQYGSLAVIWDQDGFGTPGRIRNYVSVPYRDQR
jgi:hypothetical protein